MNTIKKNTEALLEASREVGLDGNKEEANYVIMSRHQNIGQNHNLLIDNKSFETVVKLKHLGTTEVHKNCFHEEIKCRLNLGNAWYLSVQSILSSYLLSKNMKINIYKTIIFSLFCMGVKLGLSH
jgi:hypothetical protein